jgi:hypothetical protein
LNVSFHVVSTAGRSELTAGDTEEFLSRRSEIAPGTEAFANKGLRGYMVERVPFNWIIRSEENTVCVNLNRTMPFRDKIFLSA